jgi:chaperone required for assembly of F1-ATPase
VTGWTAQRFWTEAHVVAEKDGFAVHLDARPVRTPLKAPLILPTRVLAEAVASEWLAQVVKVDPRTMPFTRTANSAIDKVTPQFAEVAAMLAAYGANDLLCYRAEGPVELIARQAAAWDPLLTWAETALDARLISTAGVMHVDQPSYSLDALHRRVAALGPFHLSAFHDLVAISGSLVLAFAVTLGRLEVEAAWQTSRIDETWQIELWGEDAEAAEIAALKREAFVQADRFYALCG